MELSSESIENLYNDSRYRVPQLYTGKADPFYKITAFSDYAATIDGATKVDSATDFTDMIPQGAELISTGNCVNDDYTGFGNATPTGFDASSNGAATHYAGSADEIALVDTQEYIVSFDMVLNSGTAPKVRLATAYPSAWRSGPQDAVAGHNVMEHLQSGVNTTGTVIFYNTSTETDYEITNLTII